VFIQLWSVAVHLFRTPLRVLCAEAMRTCVPPGRTVVSGKHNLDNPK